MSKRMIDVAGPTHTHADVLVIGAGAAGISAADQLAKENISTIILEAHGIIGGRICTNYEWAEHPVEEVAEFIHGKGGKRRGSSRNDATWKYVRRFNLHTIRIPNRGYTHREGAPVPDIDSALPISRKLLRRLRSAAMAHLKNGGADLPVLEFVSRRPDLIPECPVPQAIALIRGLIANEYATDALTITGLMEADSYGKHNYRIREGYTALLRHMVEESTMDIRLNTVIRKIRWGVRGVTAITNEGKKFTGDHVIVTTPIGALQKGDLRFDPPLPKDKRDAIHSLHAGHVCKIIMEFRDNFWPSMPMLRTVSDCQLLWPPGWNTGKEAPILSALVGGEAALDFRKLRSGAPLAAAEMISEMFGLDRKAMRNLFVRGKIVDYTLRPHILTSYSSGEEGVADARRALAKALPPSMFFGGEATENIGPATVAAALRSGKRNAREVKTQRHKQTANR